MKIYRGKQTPEHKGDTSRELLDMWQESGYCEIVDGETEDVFIWANSPGDVLLYEYDRYDVYPHLPGQWKHALFGGMQHRWPNAHAWIYWGRHPRKLEAKIEKFGGNSKVLICDPEIKSFQITDDILDRVDQDEKFSDI